MRDISARELKGHNILAVERFWDNTRWMIEFSVLRPSTAYGSPGEEMRLFLTEDGYQAALQSQQRREIKIKRYARVIEGHKLREAQSFLKEVLADGPLPQTEIETAAQQAGIRPKTLRNARNELGVTSTKVSKQWVWALPEP